MRAYHHTYGLATTMSNCSNNYGPFQFPEKLIPLLIVKLLEGEELPIYGDGLNIRDWLHVEDHCRGIDRVLEAGAIGQTYNIGTDNELTNIVLVRELCKLMDRLFKEDGSLAERFPSAPPTNNAKCETAITYVTDRPGHDRRYAIDNRRITNELGFQIAVSFEQGLESTVRWYLDHEPWWRAVMDESYRDWIDQQYSD